MKKNISYLGLSFIAPGLGQFALRRWVRGAVMLLGSLATFAWAMWLVVHPMFVNISNLLAGSEKELAGMNITVILILAATMILLWVWSMVDIVVCKAPDSTEPVEKSDEEGA